MWPLFSPQLLLWWSLLYLLQQEVVHKYKSIQRYTKTRFQKGGFFCGPILNPSRPRAAKSFSGGAREGLTKAADRMISQL
jgi:hypothetical protein